MMATYNYKLFEKLSFFSFVFLFPGLFFYSSAVAVGLMPALIGGGFGFIAIVVLFILLPGFLLYFPILKGKEFLLTSLFLLFLSYVFIFSIAQYSFGGEYVKNVDVVIQSATLLANWLVVFLVGFSFPRVIDKKYYLLLLACCLGIFFITVSTIDYSLMMSSLGKSDIESSLSYQGLARSAVMVGIVVLAATQGAWSIGVVTLIVLVSLFFLGARSELVGFLLITPIVFFYSFREKPSGALSSLLFILVVLLIIFIVFFQEVSSSRQFQLFDITQSSSYLARDYFYDSAILSIKNAPLFGDFAGHSREHGSTGSYAHNIISAWRQYGLIGFLLYSALIVIPVFVSFQQVRNMFLKDEYLPKLTLLVSFFSLILVLGAKSVFWPFPALAWGLTVACYRRERFL